MGETKTVLFLCPHDAAKSVLAAADFDRLADDGDVDTRISPGGG